MQFSRFVAAPARGFLLLVLLAVLAFAPAAHGQNTYSVTLFNDTGATSLQAGGGYGPGQTPSNASGYNLRGAMLAAMAAGGTNTISFACSTPPCKITLAAPLPPVFETATSGAQAISNFNLTIDGGTQGNVVIDGASLYRAFWVDNVAVTLKNLVIQNALAKGGAGGSGNAAGGGGAGFGAGLFVN